MSAQTDDQSKAMGTKPEDSPATDPDPGCPIVELAELALPTAPEFETRVRRRIERRLSAAEVVTAPAKVAASLMRQYVTSLVRAILCLGDGDGKRPDGPP